MVRTPCCDENKVRKGKWLPEEDRKLLAYINKSGCNNWRQLPKHAGLARCGKSCRLRWMNYLRPHLKRGNYTKEEEETIIRLHDKLGNSWSAIAKHLPGRTDNEIKNHWHTYVKKHLKQKSVVQCEVKALPNSDEQNYSSSANIAGTNSEADCIHATTPTTTHVSESPSTSQQYSGEFTCSSEILSLMGNEAKAGYDNFNFWTEPFVADNFEVSPLMDPGLMTTQIQHPFFDTELFYPFGTWDLFQGI